MRVSTFSYVVEYQIPSKFSEDTCMFFSAVAYGWPRLGCQSQGAPNYVTHLVKFLKILIWRGRL